MKKTLLLAAAVMMMTGCGALKSTSTTDSTSATTATTTSTTSTSTASAQTAGQGAGTALQALYTQYKADGKFDYKNMQNIINTMTLVSNCEGLKENYKNTTYLKDFGKGMIASSLGLVTQSNVESVTNSLVDMVKNSETVQQATTTAQSTASTVSSTASTVSQYAGALSSLLSAFGK